MNVQEFQTQIKELILQGNLDDAASNLVSFFDKEYLSGVDKAHFHLYNQALHQLSQLNELKDEVIRGIISNEDADLKRNRIRSAILEIVEGLKSLDGTTQPPKDQLSTPISSESPPTARKKKPLVIIGALVLAVLLIWAIVKIVGGTGPKYTGCYIKTSLSTQLLMEPELFGGKIGTLPSYKTYPVVATATYHHVDDILFFKINDKKLGVGWVQEGIHLDFTSPACLRERNAQAPSGTDRAENNPRGNEQQRTEPISGPSGSPTPAANNDQQGPSTPSDAQGTATSDCTVRTRMMTGLHRNTEVMGTPFMTLPQYRTYTVKEVKKELWAGQPIYFFQVTHGQYTGWVREEQLDFVDPVCFD